MSDQKVVRLSRTDAVSLLSYVGFNTVQKWDNARMAAKLGSIKDVLPEGKPNDEKIAKALIDVLAGIDENAAFEVFSPEGEEAVKEDAGATKKKEEEKLAAAKEKEDKKKARDAEKAKQQAEKELAKANKIPGVRPSRANTYIAGLVIRETGLKAGVTDVLINKYVEYGGNRAGARFMLSNAWHAINAFTGEIEVPEEDEPEQTTASTGNGQPAVEKKEVEVAAVTA